MLVLKKSIFEAGFSLLEVLVSLVLCALLSLVLLRFYPSLFELSQSFKIEQELQLEADSILDKISKDLYRAGFVAQDPKMISEAIFSFRGNCLIILYDLERNGSINLGTENSNSDRFTYRLSNQSIEYKRGAKSCEGTSWYKLNDPKQFVISVFEVIERPYSYQIILTLAPKNKILFSKSYSIFIRKYHNVKNQKTNDKSFFIK